MPNPNALVARVNTISPAAGAPRVGAEAAPPEAMLVNFEGERTAVLPPGKRAAAWRRMLEFRRLRAQSAA